MPFVIMVGYPSAGKSVFADMIAAYHNDTQIIRPSDWYPPEIDSMCPADRTSYQVACWECALDKGLGLLAKCPPTTIIILDTCGANPNSLNSLLGVAKLHKHPIYVIWVATPKSVCAARRGADIVRGYAAKLTSALVYYRSIYKVIVVKDDSLDQWRILANNIVRRLGI